MYCTFGIRLNEENNDVLSAVRIGSTPFLSHTEKKKYKRRNGEVDILAVLAEGWREG